MTTTSIALAFTMLLGLQAPQPAREAVKPATGTAVMTGVVVTDDTEHRALRRVRVSVTSADRETNLAVITDDSGTFSFDRLPAGRYSLQAIKAGFVTTSYGATRPMRPGTPIVLTDGQRATGLTLRMPRGAVITGTIVDQNGEPAVGVGVAAIRRTIVNGAPQLGFPTRRVDTDDRGAFRLYELAAGDYVIAATPASTVVAGESIRLTTEADVREAFAELRSTAPSGPRAASEGSAPTIGYAAVFFPGTASSTQAGIVTVSASQERTGVDFQLQLVPTAKVEGTVLMPDGQPLKSGLLNLTKTEQSIPGLSLADAFRRAQTDAEGHFSFAGVPPGQYALVSRAGQPAPAPGPAAAVPGPLDMRTPPLWASSDVSVEGQNISGLTLTLQQGLSVSGRVVVEPGTLPPPALNRVRISMAAVLNPGEMTLGSSAATADANGQFSIEGVTPGRYKLMASLPGQRPDAPGWVAKSAILDGQDTLDFPATLRRSLEGAVITLTDKSTELSGLVKDASEQVAPEYFVIVFPADRQLWTQQSRRVQSVRPSANGRYQVRNLPPGDYLLVALVDVEQGEWQDPSFLQRMAPNGIKVTLGEGEKKTQDIKVGGS
jgi:Carboxypeptidase regulatory-like domain